MKGTRWLAWPALLLSLMIAPAMGADQQSPEQHPASQQPSDEEQSAEEAPMDSEALDDLNLMADTLAQAQGFSVTIRAGFDVVQDNGQKITFGERRQVTLSRPDRLRIEAEESDGKKTLVTYDGQAITVFNPEDNVYGQVEKAGSVDDVIRYVVQDLDIRLPLALLLVTTLPEELDQRLEAIDYVERDTLTTVPTDHLAGRGAGGLRDLAGYRRYAPAATTGDHLQERRGRAAVSGRVLRLETESRHLEGGSRIQPAGWGQAHPIPGQSPPATRRPAIHNR
jgi:hypothetical protein